MHVIGVVAVAVHVARIVAVSVNFVRVVAVTVCVGRLFLHVLILLGEFNLVDDAGDVKAANAQDIVHVHKLRERQKCGTTSQKCGTTSQQRSIIGVRWFCGGGGMAG